MKNLLIVLIATAFMFSCSESKKDEKKDENKVDTLQDTIQVEEKSVEIEVQEMLHFEDILLDFIDAFNAKDVEWLNSYVDPELGFAVKTNPGAFIFITGYSDFGEILEKDNQNELYYFKEMNLEGEPVNADIPVYDCETEWSAEGFFWTEGPEIKLKSLYESLVEFEIVEKDDELIEYYRTLDTMITHGFYITNEAIGFYFGMINGQWKLLCIDRVDPCSA